MGLKLKNDVIFKAVFGQENEESKQALIGMLNLLLDRKDDPIRRIIYKNPFNIRDIDVQKESILDIKAETDSGELLDVEMQLLYDEEFIPRNVYYHSGMVTQGLAAGMPYGKLKKTISIYLLDYIWFQDDDSYHKCFQLIERKSGLLLTELMEMHYFELPKVNPRRCAGVDELTKTECFLEFLRYAGENGNSGYLASLKQHGGKEIQMADVIMQKVTEEERLREQAIARDKFLHRQASIERQLKAAKEVLAQRDEYERQINEYERQNNEYEHQIKEYQEEMEKSQQQNRQLKDIIDAMLSTGVDKTELARTVHLTEEELDQYIK